MLELRPEPEPELELELELELDGICVRSAISVNLGLCSSWVDTALDPIIVPL